MSKGTNVAKKFAKGAARVGGRVFLPLAALMSVFDAATGVANAGELLDKEDDELTFRDKASAGFAGFLSGLTFGLADKEKLAKKFAGSGDKGVNNLDEGTYDIGNDVQTVPESVKKGDALSEQIEADVAEIRKNHFTTNNINNVAAPVNNTNVAKSEAILPHMSNKNTDKTVIDIQDVF